MRFVTLLVSLVSVALLATPPPRPRRDDGEPLVPRPELVRALFASVLPLATDYWWIQTTNAIGRALTGPEYRAAYFYADLATDLDPNFETVYGFVGVGIPHHETRERWVNVDESNAILEKGLRVYPLTWRYKFFLAYNKGFLQHHWEEAGKLLSEAARLPGAPAYTSALATRFLAQGNDLDGARHLAITLEQEAPDPETRAFWQKRRLQIDLEEILRTIEGAIAEHVKRTGTTPKDVQELVQAGLLPGIPEDPLGGTFRIGADGVPYSTSEFKRMVVFDEEAGR